MKDEPIVYGDDCLLGWAEGETPKYVYARFSQIVKCPGDPPGLTVTPPNDRVFKLTQDSVNPCLWVFENGPWVVTFRIVAGPVRTWLNIENLDDGWFYFDATPEMSPEEGFVYHNEQTDCDGDWGAKDGFGVVTWTPQATDLLEAINLIKGNDLFMELRPLINGRLVYKFCRLEDATNIKILFEP